MIHLNVSGVILDTFSPYKPPHNSDWTAYKLSAIYWSGFRDVWTWLKCIWFHLNTKKSKFGKSSYIRITLLLLNRFKIVQITLCSFPSRRKKSFIKLYVKWDSPLYCINNCFNIYFPIISDVRRPSMIKMVTESKKKKTYIC